MASDNKDSAVSDQQVNGFALSGPERRFRTTGQVGYTLSLVFHLVFIGVFYAAGETGLAIFNVGSVVVTALALRAIFKNRFLLAGILVSGEVVAHAIVATIVLGPGSGFQLYVFAVIAVGQMFPASWAARAVFSLLSTAALIGLAAYSQFNAPLHVLPEIWEIGFLAANLIGLATILVLIVSSYAYVAVTAENEAEKAHSESERLLHNILPVAIAERLKSDPGTAADRFSDVSIVFADIVGFTPMAERLAPEALVEWLDKIIGALDELAEKFGVEKIKTIGDAWLGAAGVPEPCEDHAERVADFAMATLEEARRIAEDTQTPLQLRIGISTGSVVAGVIGRRKFSYDLWGDPVNMAARMESSGVPGEVQVSPESWALLKDKFAFEARGPREIKGKGMVETYLLKGRV